MTSLNPVFTIGDQISEALLTHNPGMKDDPRGSARSSCSRAWASPSPSGASISTRTSSRAGCAARDDRDGDGQRPEVLIADEPTTALDVTIQAQIVEVSSRTGADARRDILITHDLGLIAELADRVVVMYAGRVVEIGDVYTISTPPVTRTRSG